MREIKFRGKRIDNGEWVYGSYFSFVVAKKTVVGIYDEVGNAYMVVPDTVGQHVKGDSYTGDIFHVVCDCDSEYGCTHPSEDYELIWHERYLQYGFQRGSKFVLLDEFGEENIHLIGNIHDNPELLTA